MLSRGSLQNKTPGAQEQTRATVVLQALSLPIKKNKEGKRNLVPKHHGSGDNASKGSIK